MNKGLFRSRVNKNSCNANKNVLSSIEEDLYPETKA